MSRNYGSLADKAILDRLQRDPESTSVAQNVDLIDLKKVDNPQEKEMLAEFDRRKKARTLMIPTDDYQVKLMLRQSSSPICLFGEDVLDRRERLRAILSRLSDEEVQHILRARDERDKPDSQEDTCAWYHHGPPELRGARIKIADFSLRRAKARLNDARQKASRSQQEKALAKQETHKRIQNISIYGSQVTGTRAAAFSDFSSDSKHIITANWSGQVSIWNIPNCAEQIRFQGHGAQAGCARFHPGAYVYSDEASVNAASCDHDGNVLLWSLNSQQPIAEIEKHEGRVGHVIFHPSGLFLGTTCYDRSWRLFDLDTRKEVLFQEGHSRGVHALDFHPDGSLALSGSLDCYGRVWDLRTGKCVMYLEGHQKPVNTVTWHPNGFVMVTGSGDNACKIWDIRMRRCTYTIPAHKNLVSSVRIDATGEYMVTSSYDCTLKLWTTSGWQPLKVLEGHHMKVMNVALSPDSNWIASSCFDRTFKLWTPENTF